MSFLPYGAASSSGWFGAVGASAVLHGGAVLGIVGLSASAMNIEIVPTRAAFTVTLDQLDADTLAGLLEQEGEAGALGEAEQPDIDVPTPAAGEGLDPTVPDNDPSVGTTVALPLETPTAIQPETLAAQPALPDVVEPSPIIAETLSAVEAAASISPVVSSGNVTLGPNTIGEADTITSNLSGTDPANAEPRIPAPPPAPPTAQDLAIGDLIERIRDAPSQTCLVGLPRRDGPDGIGLAMIAAQDSAMENFAQSVLTAEDGDIRQTRTLIDPRQCPALSFVGANAVYPAMQLGIQVDSTEVASGGTITGVLRGVAGRYLTLVMVDDNGVVIDLQRFTSQSGNLARFDVPVTRVGLGRDTSPVILAIASDRPVPAIRDRMGLLAQDVFVQLVTGSLDDAHLGLVTIDVR